MELSRLATEATIPYGVTPLPNEQPACITLTRGITPPPTDSPFATKFARSNSRICACDLAFSGLEFPVFSGHYDLIG